MDRGNSDFGQSTRDRRENVLGVALDECNDHNVSFGKEAADSGLLERCDPVILIFIQFFFSMAVEYMPTLHVNFCRLFTFDAFGFSQLKRYGQRELCIAQR